MIRKVEFAILGAGAMGSIIGAHLARAGHQVAMLARGLRAERIQNEGLRITGLADFTSHVEVITEPRNLRTADVLIVATKAIDTVGTLEPLRATDIGVALSIQNGVMKEELLARVFGRTRILGASANISGELMSSGQVTFTRNDNILVGECGGGVSVRAERVAAIMDASGVRAIAVADIRAQEWCKFAGWLGLMALAVTIRRNTWEFLLDPGAALVMVRVVRELERLAHVCGIELSAGATLPILDICRGSESEAVEIVMRLGQAFRAGSPHHRVSTLQDLEAGRRLEIEETVGYAIRRGAELGLRLPLLEMVFHIAGAIDRARRSVK